MLIRLIAMIAVAGPLSTIALACDTGDVDVIASDEYPSGYVCHEAERTMMFLKSCGIPMPKRVTFVVKPNVGKVSHYGVFDPFAGQVSLLPLGECMSEVLHDDARKAADPFDYCRSVVAHETVHAIMHYASRDNPINAASHEYLAYALQLGSLTSTSLAAILATSEGMKATMPDEALLFFRPELFAGMSFRHFQSIRDDCGVVRKVLSGELAATGYD